jgi:hypothetical protein
MGFVKAKKHHGGTVARGRPKDESDYGLPTLTFQEAARVLGIDHHDFSRWVWENAGIKRPNRFGEWRDGKRPVPEALIRLYLMTVGARAATPPARDRTVWRGRNALVYGKATCSGHGKAMRLGTERPRDPTAD